MSDDSSDQALEAQRLVESIRQFLAGKGGAVQSAALADLVSIWLAGMFVVGNPKATEAMRDEHLAVFMRTVLDLIPINEELITKPMLERKLKTQ